MVQNIFAYKWKDETEESRQLTGQRDMRLGEGA